MVVESDKALRTVCNNPFLVSRWVSTDIIKLFIKKYDTWLQKIGCFNTTQANKRIEIKSISALMLNGDFIVWHGQESCEVFPGYRLCNEITNIQDL